MKFSVGFNLLYLDHIEHETYYFLYFSLPHLHHSFSHFHLRPKEIHTWGMLWPGEKAFPAHLEASAHSLGKVGSESQQQVSVTWYTGPHNHCTLHGCFGCAQMNKLYMAKPSTLWSNGSHDTSRIQESMKIGNYCNEANKIYLLLLLFRICTIFNHNSVR